MIIDYPSAHEKQGRGYVLTCDNIEISQTSETSEPDENKNDRRNSGGTHWNIGKLEHWNIRHSISIN